MKAPAFWWRPDGIASALLSPLSLLYAAVAERPFGKGRVSAIPVLCIGNFVAGGAGKTPLAIALAERARRLGRKPVFLTRGHGGAARGPRLVDPVRDDARLVGDEPLLLARHGAAVVAKDRRAGIAFIEAGKLGNIVLMDDGFQSAAVKPRHAMLALDAARGVGNGRVLPAGPLRARLSTQIAHADSLMVIESAGMATESPTLGGLKAAFEAAGKPVHKAMAVPRAGFGLSGPAIAFSGIGDPEKFFCSLRHTGVETVETVSFADHHFFTEAEADALLRKAFERKARLVATAKDAARLEGEKGSLARLRDAVTIFEIDIVFENAAALDAMLEKL